MSSRPPLDVIEEIDRALAELDRRALELRRAKRVILQMRQQLPWDMESAFTHTRTEPATPTFRTLRDPGLKLHEAAELVLSQAMEPMGVQELAERLVSGGYHYPRGIEDLKESLRAIIARNARVGGALANFGRGKYGLREWNNGVQVNYGRASTAVSEMQFERITYVSETAANAVAFAAVPSLQLNEGDQR